MDSSPDIVVLGGGPGGLAFAHGLLDRGVRDFLVLEKEAEAGGLCRSAVVDGAPLDVCGGHFVDVRRPAVTDFLFRFMPENEWNLFERNTKIRLLGQMIGSPVEANIWQLDESTQRRYLDDIAAAKGLDMDELMSEIEGIVATGTKLNLDYYIEQNVDEDVVDDIYAYFCEDAESDSVAEAMEKLGPDYEEMEIRLVRIKFLCEIAS